MISKPYKTTEKMFIAYLKNGDTLRVQSEQLEEFLVQNQEQIQVQQKEMGKRRSVSTEQQSKDE